MNTNPLFTKKWFIWFLPIFCYFLNQYAFPYAVYYLSGQTPLYGAIGLPLTFVAELIQIALLVYILLQLGQKSWLVWKKPTWKGFWLGVGLYFASVYSRGIIQAVFFSDATSTANNDALATMAQQMSPLHLAIFVAFMVVSGPIYEELLFRGLLMTSYFKNSKYYLDVILSSVLFSLPHVLPYGWDTAAFINYGLMGFFFAIAVRITGSLRTSITLHMVNNLIATVVLLSEVLQ